MSEGISWLVMDETESIIVKLISAGLTEEEARTYFYLSRIGAVTASELARYTKMSRVKTYRILKMLENRGIIETTIERPMKFIAMPVASVIDILEGVLKNRIDQLEASRKYLVDRWTEIELPSKIAGRDEKFRIIQGRETIDIFIEMLIHNAKKEIVMISSKYLVYRFLEYVGELKKAKGRGVSITIVTELDESTKDHIKVLKSAGAIYHSESMLSSQFIIVDHTEVVLFLISDQSLHPLSRNETVLWTNSNAIVNIEHQFYDNISRNMVDIEMFKGDVVEKKFITDFRVNSRNDFQILYELIQFALIRFKLDSMSVDLLDIVNILVKAVASRFTKKYVNLSKEEFLSRLSEIWRENGLGELEVVKNDPLTIAITSCNSCGPVGEIGEILCARTLEAIVNCGLGVKCTIQPTHQRVGKRCVFTEKTAVKTQPM